MRITSTFSFFLSVLLLLILSFRLHAQDPVISWSATFGNADVDLGQAMAVDASGNTYYTGSFSGSVDFEPGAGNTTLTSAGLTDIYVLKLSSTGSLLWAKQIGAASDEAGNDINIGPSGNIYITGSYSGTLDFDPGAGTADLTAAGTDAFVLVLDAAGNFVSATSIGGAGSETGQRVEVDGSGNTYLAGTFVGTSDLDPGPATYPVTSAGSEDVFYVKLDASGNFLHGGSIGGIGRAHV